MKHFKALVSCIALCSMALHSCSIHEVANEDLASTGNILFTIDDFEPESNSGIAVTKTNCDPSNNFSVTWASGDTIGIFPLEGFQEPFAIPVSQVGNKSASFDGGYWDVKSGLTYNAYYPFSISNFLSADSKTKIPVAYTGQTQTGTQCNVGAFDYTYSDWTAASDGKVSFNFHHIGSFLVLKLPIPATTTYTSLALEADSEVIPTAGTYDLTATKPAFVSTATTYSLPMSLNSCSLTGGDTVIFYMMVPPCDLSSSTLTLVLTSAAGTSCIYDIDSKNIQASKLYRLTGKAKSSTIEGTVDNWGEEEPTTYTYVDLGLSVKWATCNVGATQPYEYGDYFAWGATEPYYESGYAQRYSPVWKSGKSAGYNWSSYKYCNGSYNTMTKYCNDSSYGYNGYTDSKTVLDAEDDAATANWGGAWRMPTKAEIDELTNSDNCTWTWYASGNSEYNGIAGYKVTSKKSGYTDRSVFLPASGYRWSTNLSDLGSYDGYWSSSLRTYNPYCAYGMNVSSGNYDWSIGDSRFNGRAVRPVCNNSNFIHITSVSLNKSATMIAKDNTEQLTATILPDNASNKTLSWSSSNTSVATVDQTGLITAVASGTCMIIASSALSSKSDTCQVTVFERYVDLGLSVKWATCNVGATKPYEYGDYFAWGATEPYYESGYAQSDSPVWKSGMSGGYTWANAPYQTISTEDFSSTRWTKYLGSTTSDYKDSSATDADALKSVLDAEDDAAAVNWGGTWRMPTSAELQELRNSDNCTWTWYASGNSEYNGIAGYKVTSKKSGYTDRSIFLPVCGWRPDTYLWHLGYIGYYWSSSLCTDGPDSPDSASSLDLRSEYYVMSDGFRKYGRAVRPVCQ